MNWFIETLIKEARGRRFQASDRVRYFTEKRKGKGSVVLTPSFSRGEVMDFNSDTRQYSIKNDNNEIVEVHPRNLIPDSAPFKVPLSNSEPMSVAPAVAGASMGDMATSE